MKILSNVDSEDLKARFDEKRKIYNTFAELDSSQTIDITLAYDGAIYILADASLIITITHSDLQIGGSFTIIGHSSGTSSVTTTDAGHPTTSVDLSAGQHVECIWTGSLWLFKGNYTI